MLKCPVCGKEYDSVSKVIECLEEHEEMEMENECEALEKELHETYNKLQELVNTYNEKYGFTFITNLCTFDEWLDENEDEDEEEDNDKCNCTESCAQTKSFEEFLKNKLNIEDEKKANPKKLSMRDCYDLAHKEGEEAVYKYFNTLSPDELKDLLDDGIKTLCEDLSSLLSE